MQNHIRLAAESAYFQAAGISNGLTATELEAQLPVARAIRIDQGLRDPCCPGGEATSAREAAEVGLSGPYLPMQI
ncbi:MAG: hypothetical protein R2789_13260 [Microthrixaceae bacterium]